MYRIQYSNCWEDASVVIKALDIKPHGAYLSIASAGDNTLSILSQNPRLVLAVDVNPAQLACLEIRAAAIGSLSYTETLKFLGVKHSNRRISMYHDISSSLSQWTRKYWDERQSDIKKGIIHGGSTERNFQRFRKYVLPLLFSKNDKRELLAKQSSSQRQVLCDRILNTWHYHFIMRSVFSKAMIRQLKVGKYSTFYNSGNGNLADIVMERVDRGLRSPLVHDNPYISYIMTGNFNNALPFYLHKEAFNKIKRNLNALKTYCGTVQQTLAAFKKLTFDGYNFSDIFEYMDNDTLSKCIRTIIDRANENARIVYWNTLREYNAASDASGFIRSCKILEKQLSDVNISFFYASLHVNEVKR